MKRVKKWKRRRNERNRKNNKNQRHQNANEGEKEREREREKKKSLSIRGEVFLLLNNKKTSLASFQKNRGGKRIGNEMKTKGQNRNEFEKGP